MRKGAWVLFPGAMFSVQRAYWGSGRSGRRRVFGIVRVRAGAKDWCTLMCFSVIFSFIQEYCETKDSLRDLLYSFSGPLAMQRPYVVWLLGAEREKREIDSLSTKTTEAS